ncbi:MAG: HAD family hydrolase [Alphaproteobacteria bacterium]|nr:HAD family hydrolase [Alphaproteobacteria bacterium]
MTQKIILWDWDNTLVDTFNAILSAQNVMRHTYGLPSWTKEEAKTAMNTSGRNLIKDIVGAEKASEARAVYLKAYAQSAAEITLKPYAIDALEKAKSLGYINILASNKAGSILRNEAHTLNVDSYFDRIIGAEDTPCDKPSKSFTDSAIAGFDAEQIISIGDGKADITMGHNYTNGTGLLVWTDPTTTEFNEIKPDASFTDLQTLSGYLEKLSAK